MSGYSTSTSSSSSADEGEPDTTRLSSPRLEFLSHLHSRRGATSNVFHRPRAPSPVVPPPKRRSLAVSFAMVHGGGADMGNSRTDDQGSAHQQRKESSGTSSTSSPLGEPSHFRGSTGRDIWSEHAENPDGEFTFRGSSTMQKARASNESVGFDLVGSVICGPSESPVSSISSHRYSGKSTAGGEEVLDSWLRQTTKLRNSVVIKGVPIVSKSLIELAKARREREAIEESDESDSDSDATSSLSISKAANGRRDVAGRNAAKGIMRVSTSQNTPPASPTVVFRSPAESLSDTTPTLQTRISEHGGRGGAGKEAKGLVKSAPLASSRSAISLTPRVTFKSLAVAQGTPFAPTPLILDKTPERESGRRRPQARIAHGVGKGEIRKASGVQGLSGGGRSPGPMKGPRSVSPAALEPMARASAGKTTTVVAPTGERGGENGTGLTKSASDTAAAVPQAAASGRSGRSSAAFRPSGSRRGSVAGSLTRRDSSTKPATPTRQPARTSDTPNMTSPPDISASLSAVEGSITRVDGTRTGFLPGEATAVPRSASEENPSATLQPEASPSSESKRESQELKTAESKVGTPGITDEGGAAPSILQDTMAIRGKDADVVEQVPPFQAQLDISGSATKASDESASITLATLLEKLVPELDGCATGPEDSKEGRLEAELGRPDDELHRKANREQQGGDQKEGVCPQQCGAARGAEEEEVGGKEETRNDEKTTGVSPPPSADDSGRHKHPDGDDPHGETERTALPNTERAVANEDSRSQPRPPAHPVAGSQQRETTPVTNTEQEKSQPAAPAVHATIPADIRLNSALQQQLVSSPAPNAVLQSPAKLPSPTGSENYAVVVLGKPSDEARRDASSGESRETESASSHPEVPLTTRANGASEPRHVRILTEATTRLENGGNATSSAAISSTGRPFSGCDGGDSCDETGRSGKMDLTSIHGRSATPTEARQKLVVRDPRCARALTEAEEMIASGGSKKKLTAPSPAKQTCKDGHDGADGSTWTNEKSASSNLRPRVVVNSDNEVVKDALSASFQAETSRISANTSSMKEPSAIPPVKSMGKPPQGCAHEKGKRVTGGMDRALSASRLVLPSTAPSSVARDRWSVRILVEARATLACGGVLGRCASLSPETVSGLLPSVEEDDQCGHKATRAEQRDRGGGGGRCSAPRSCRRKRLLSLPIMHARSSRSTGRRKRLCLHIAQRRSSEDSVAACVHRWTACGPGSSELPAIVDIGSYLVGSSASKLLVCRGRTMCIRDGGRGSQGPVKNTGDTPRPSQGNPQRWQREGNTREQEIVLVPTRPPERAHPLDGTSTCVSRASLAMGKGLAVGGSRCDGEDAAVEFQGHIVVTTACWKPDGDGGDAGGRGFVAGDRGRRRSSPDPRKRSTESAAKGALRRSSCPWSGPSPPQLPIVVDTGSLELDELAPAWAVKTPELRQRDVTACRRTKGAPQH